MLQNEIVSRPCSSGVVAAILRASSAVTNVVVPGLNQLACSTLTAPLSVPGSLAAWWRVSPLKNSGGRASTSLELPPDAAAIVCSRDATGDSSTRGSNALGATVTFTLSSGRPAAVHAATPPFSTDSSLRPSTLSVQ